MGELAKTAFAPGTLGFALVSGGVSILLTMSGGVSRRVGIALLALISVGYYVAAMPWTASRVSAALIFRHRVRSVPDARGATAVVVLSGDSEDSRIVEAVRVDALLKPEWIILAGPPVLRDALIEGGIEARRILLEASGRTTHDQAVHVAGLLRSRRIDRVVLVASAIHMPRALATFRRVGIDTIPSASATRPIAGAPRFWPLRDALRLSRESLYEYAATAYYEWRGWVGPVRMDG